MVTVFGIERGEDVVVVHSQLFLNRTELPLATTEEK